MILFLFCKNKKSWLSIMTQVEWYQIGYQSVINRVSDWCPIGLEVINRADRLIVDFRHNIAPIGQPDWWSIRDWFNKMIDNQFVTDWWQIEIQFMTISTSRLVTYW